MSSKAKVTFERVKLSITGSDHPVAYLNTSKTDPSVIKSALAEFNESAPVAGELFPNFAEPEYAESDFAYVNEERRCFEVSDLYLDNDACIYGKVSFFISNKAELENVLKLIQTLEEVESKAGLYPKFDIRALLSTDVETQKVHGFNIIGFDILPPEQAENMTPFPISSIKLKIAAIKAAIGDSPHRDYFNIWTTETDNDDNLKEKGLVPLSDKQIVDMLMLQDKMNRRVRENWKEDPFPYLEAVINEGAEARDHFGWKWWKKQVPNSSQVKMELVDIHHFNLSEIILAYPNSMEDQIREIRYLSGASLKPTGNGFLENMNRIIGDATEGRYNIWAFDKCMKAMDFTWEELYRWYIGKNVLNFFRQDNGYKEGTYVKIWKGREDNEYLFDILDSMDPNTDDVQKFIYDALSATYHSAVSDSA